MTILGPFESTYSRYLLTIENGTLILVKMNLWQTIQEMFYDFRSTLETKNIDYIQKNFPSTRLTDFKGLKISVIKSKFWKHRLIINYNANLTKLSVVYRNELDTYITHLSKTLEDNFILVEKE